LGIEFFLIGLIIFFASFAQGFAGFGFALVSIPLLSMIIDIKHAIPLGALCGLVINIYLLIELKDHVKFFNFKNLLFGSLVGIPIGAYFLAKANPDLLKTILGILILLFVFFSITQKIRATGLNDRWGYFFGLLSGLFGGALNTNGPPVLVYFYLQGWDKVKQKASITGFFIITSVIIVSMHITTGVTTEGVFKDFLIYLPFVIIGQIIGNRLFNKIPSLLFQKVILYSLLLISIITIFR